MRLAVLVPRLVFLCSLSMTLGACRLVSKRPVDASSGAGVNDGVDDEAEEPSVELPGGCTGGLADGGTYSRTGYLKANPTLGKETCQSEQQTCTCNDGTITCTGSYYEDSCAVIPATIESGDIVFATEPQASYYNSYGGATTLGGAIQVIGADGTYKGVAVERIATASGPGILRYISGMTLDWDSLNSIYNLTIATPENDNGSLPMRILRFPEGIDPAGSAVTLSSAEQLSNTGDYNGSFFFHGSSSMGSNRYISNDGGTPVVEVYASSNGGAKVSDCTITYPSPTYDGWRITNIFGRQDGFGSVYVGRVKDGNFAVDYFNQSCTSAGGTPATPIYDLGTGSYGSFAKVCNFTKIQYATGSLNNHHFLMATNLSNSSALVRYDSSGVTQGSSGLNGGSTPLGIYYPTKGGGDHNIYTIETNGATGYVRKYDTSGNLVSTVYSDPTDTIIPSDMLGFCVYMVVVP